MNPIEWFESLPTGGKIAVGCGAAAIILFIWKPWASSSGSTSTDTSGETYATDTGDDSGVGYDTSGNYSYGSGGGGSDTGVGLPTLPTGASPSPILAPVPATGIGATPTGQQVTVAPTSVTISQPEMDTTSGVISQNTITSIAANQTAADVTAGTQWNSTVTNIAPKNTGGVTQQVVSTIASAANTNIVAGNSGYTVAQGGASYNAAVNGAGDQWLVDSAGKPEEYKGDYNSQGQFVATLSKGQLAPASKPGGNTVTQKGNQIIISPKKS